MSDLYQPIIGADDIRQAYKDHLALWAPAYLAEVARQAGLDGPLADFQSFEIRARDALEDHVALPALSVFCDELDPLGRDGDGDYDARAQVVVKVYGGAPTDEDAAQLVARLAKAVRAAVVQHGQIGGLAVDTVWVAEVLAEPVPDAQAEAFVAGAAVIFTSLIGAAVNAHAGPTVPPADPAAEPADVPTVETVTVTVDHLEP